MKYVWIAGALATAAGTVAAQNSGCSQENGNWYCSQVDAISYSNFGTAGQFQEVTLMGATGQCEFAPESYQGGMAPFDGEVSWHFRGPIQLKQFAYYTPGSSLTKRLHHPSPHHRRYAHAQYHRQGNGGYNPPDGSANNEVRGSDDWIVANINGQVVSWRNPYAQPATAAAPTPSPANDDWITATINGQVVSWPNPNAVYTTLTPAVSSSPPEASDSSYAAPTLSASSPAYSEGGGPASSLASSPASSPVNSAASPSASSPASTLASSPASSPSDAAAGSSASSSAAPTMNAGAGQWGRQAYYNAEQGSADGLVFLNHHGGDGSGVFDTVWGMSLSYASADNSGGSPSPVTLADTLVGDNSEFVIMSDKPCSDGTCGATRPGTVAYHGFDGASKLFLIEFSMPLSGQTGFNADMPAAWMLNAQVPRTEQYGDCSCWQSGCGEFDIFEVLDSGNQKCKSTWHGAHSLGDSNWFPRPVAGTTKAAVVLDGTASTAHIIILPSDASFDTAISESTIAGYLNSISDPNLNIKTALAS